MSLRLSLIAFVATVLSANSTSVANDLQLLQGTWEGEVVANGTTYRVVKTIDKNREIVEQFDDETLVHRHEVEFSLDESGEVKVFRYQDGRVTFGNNEGAEMPDSAYAYRLEGDHWIGIYGILKEDTGAVYAIRFRRL